MLKKSLYSILLSLVFMATTKSASAITLTQLPTVDFYMEKAGSSSWEKVDNGELLVQEILDLDAFSYLNFAIPEEILAGTNLQLELVVKSQNLKQNKDYSNGEVSVNGTELNVHYIFNDDSVINHPNTVNNQSDLVLGNEAGDELLHTEYFGYGEIYPDTTVLAPDSSLVFDLGGLKVQETVDNSLSLLLTLEGASKSLVFESPELKITIDEPPIGNPNPVPEPSSIVLGTIAGIAGLARRFFKAA